MEEMWQDVPRQLWRSARKRLGLPASPDVGRLAILLKQLYAAALVHTGSNTSVVVSYPSLFALYDEDVFDAMQYLDMRTLRDFYFYEPRQIDAAYAGHGMGLCKTYKNREKCYSQGLDLLVRDVLLIEYIQASLVLHVKRVREAQDLGWSDMDATVTFDLGSGSKHSADHASRLQWEISALLRKVYQIKPSKVFVIFTGESGGDLDLQKLVKDVIEDFGYDVELFTSTPEFIASRGAAELAWRAQFLKRSS